LEHLVLIALALLLGGLFGTLINVIATRLPGDVAIVGPPLRSASGEPDPRQLLPFAVARLPGVGFDWPNLATQLGAALLVGISLLLHGWSFAALQAITLSLVLLTILRIDWQHHSIYIITIWPGILLALVFAVAQSPARLLSASVAGILAAFVFLLLFFLAIAIYKKRALGFGDVLLAGLIGTMVGLEWVTHAIMLGMILAAVGGLFLVLIRVKKRTDYIPYGAYLSLGAILIVLATT
jgi:leader peptidase (prepilin peptidase) / N-methyltransferase